MKKTPIRKRDILEYHEGHRPGKIEVVPTKPSNSQRDLSIAYSPGVAEPCLEIAENPEDAYRYTAKGNLVAVISNGTAVLGLGDIGPLASKPVMEGKGVLFKIFADIDVFDLELDTKDPDKFVETVKILAPTFGGVNLEDISAPDCFYIEKRLREELDIPIMHDDQHGTAIITGAALLNATELVGKKLSEVRVVFNGAGASAISCARLYLALGVTPENLIMCDSKGVIHDGRDDLTTEKLDFKRATKHRTLADALVGADVFVGLSKGNILSPEMIKSMAANPVVFALANPDPEINYDVAIKTRKDLIMATGRSDNPNQVNNVLGFPYIFRGALDAGASTITPEMEVAAVHAIAELAQAEQSEVVAAAYAGENLAFGPEYLIPKPFDPRLMMKIAPAVVQAAIASGVAQRPITDMDAYREKLQSLVYASGAAMKPIFSAAKRGSKKRICFAEGEDERVLRAAQIVLDEGLAKPILIGRPAVISQRIERFGLRMSEGVDYQVVNVEDDHRYRDFWQTYHRMTERKGVTQQLAKIDMRRRLTLIGCMMVHKGEADGLICGTWSTPDSHLQYVDQVIGLRPGVSTYACMNALLLPERQLFLVDTHINYDPSAEQLAEITVMAAEEMKRFGVEPKAALLSHSNFGSSNHPTAQKMRRTLALVQQRAPWLEIDGEMHGDVAIDSVARQALMPHSTLLSDANLLVLPNLDAANITYNLLKTAAGGNIAIGPVLLGAAKQVQILTASTTVRRIVNMTAIAVADINAVR